MNDGDTDPPVEFADPPKSEYGNVPFWWWDGDELSEDRITDQLETLCERGVEAVCFEQKYPHGPPEGPQAPYFSEEWWSYMEHAVAECDRLGMTLWIHDETYHHSPPEWKRYWQNQAERAIDDAPELQGHVLDRVAADVAAGETATLDLPAEFTPFSVTATPRTDGSLSLDDAVDIAVDGDEGENGGEGENTVATDDSRTVTWTAPADGTDEWHVAAVGYRPEGLCRTSRAVVDWIVEQHYEEYERRVGDALGETLVGTFQDELYQLQGSIPCDEALIDRYRAEWGEDLAPRAVALFEDCGPGTAAVRARFWDVVVTALEENWFRPLYEWHDRRGLRLAHDNWGRNDLTEHATEYGDYVRTMRWYHEPGYDDGGRFEGVGTRNFFDGKLAASIAANYGRERVWGELFHTTGWGFPPDLHLAGVAENACYGLDRYNKHGLYYATLGGWYEHAPPDTHFRQPYWEHMDAFNDVVTRLMSLCSRGDRVVDAAMLYPITSLHGLRSADPDPDVDGPGGHHRSAFPDLAHEIDERTRETAEAFYDDVADLLFVDHETVRDGAVVDGEFVFAGGSADVFLLGPVATVRRTVAERVVEFVADGGTVVSLGRLPDETVEGGADDPALADLLGVFDLAPEEAPAPPPENPAVTAHGDGTAVRAASVEAVASVVENHAALDVDAPGDVYHAHRRDGDLDTCLFLNTRDEARTLDLSVRASGRPERFDLTEGTVEPVREYDREAESTALTLDFAPHEFHVVGFRDGDGEEVAGVDGEGERVASVDGEGERVTGVDDDSERVADESEATPLPDPVALDEGWTFRLEPTMDNEWGDFRYPASDDVLGPEVRAFDHRAEDPDEDGLAAGWHDADSSDDWERRRWSYAHHWWRRPNAAEPGAAPDEDPDGWEPYEFSRLTGRPGTHADDHGHNGVVSDDFLVAPAGDAPSHFWTTVAVDEETHVACHAGDEIRRLTVGGDDVDPSDGDAADPVECVLSPGPTPVRVVVEPDAQTHVAFEPTPAEAHQQDMAHVPRLRWFHDTDALAFDPKPWADEAVDWYRFAVPVGATGFDVPVAGDCRVWVDGDECAVEDGRVTVDGPLEDPATVVVRGAGDTVDAGGARWTKPAAVETAPATVETGDWRELGLTGYSGIGVYRRTVTVPEGLDCDDHVVLDLGDLNASARVVVDGDAVGTAVAPPYEVDLTDAVSPGADHDVEVRVANTVANHFELETPTRYVYEGQTAAGLFGPVELRFERR